VRIVLDTNVALSALLWRGTPHDLLRPIRQHEHAQLFASIVLLEDLGEVLNRLALAQRLALLGRAAERRIGPDRDGALDGRLDRVVELEDVAEHRARDLADVSASARRRPSAA
jgi:hypothetical protein